MKKYATIGDIGHLRPINSVRRLWFKRYASSDLSGTRYSMGGGGGGEECIATEDNKHMEVSQICLFIVVTKETDLA